MFGLINLAVLSGASGTPLDAIETLAPIGLWYADDFVTTPRTAIKNRMAASEASLNLLNAPRRLFNNFYGKANVTVVDNAAVGPDGLTEATTVVWGSAAAALTSPGTVNLPAGTYTLAVDVRTTDGATVNFHMGNFSALETKTATSSWQSFSATFTIASPITSGSVNIVKSVDSSTPANLAICNARLFSGAVDLGAETLAGHMYFTAVNWNTQPTMASGELTTLANRWGLIQFSTQTLTAWTVVALSKRTAAAGAVIQSILADVKSFTTLTSMHATGLNAPGAYFGAADLQNGVGGLFQYRNNDWHTIVNRYSTPNFNVFMDNVRLHSRSSAGLSASLDDLFANAVFSVVAGYTVHAIAIFDRALSNAEVATVTDHLKTRSATFGITAGPNTRFLVAEGDSLTFGLGATNGSYAFLFGPNSSPVVNGNIHAITGSTLASLNSRAATLDAAIPVDKGGRQFVMSVLIGANDLYNYVGGATQYAADVSAYCLARKAAGWDKVVLCTVLPRGDVFVTEHNTARATLNAIYTGPGWIAANGVDAIADFAADPTVGPDEAALDISLYGDNLHLTNLGQSTIEPIYRATINGL
jgi:hypothetical protein